MVSRRPHVLAIPYPAQGHVIPVMELAQCLAKNGIKVTFVNTEFNHDRIVKALAQTGGDTDEQMHLVSIPDGLELGEDRNDLGKLTLGLWKVVPEKLKSLIEKINGEDGDDGITCVIADYQLAWVLDVVKELGTVKKLVAFLPAAAAMLALALNTSKLVDDGIINGDGTPLKQDEIQLSPDMPAISPLNFAWACIGDLTTQKIMFQSMLDDIKSAELADWSICNSSYELEPGAFALVPNCLPVGPLLASHRLGKTGGYFWPSEDSASLEWLDQQPPNSTIFVAFGSFTIFDQTQFQELAIGLEHTNRPFLWVVRQDVAQDGERALPKGFRERIEGRGRLVGWAPQQKVLSHPSVGCFVSHCGWNSTVEGVSNGVPFLCWPYFADQFINRSYICDYWKVGLGLDKDETGIVRGEEIRKKVELLMSDGSFKNRVLSLQSRALASIADGGSSKKNFDNFVDWIKEN